MIRVPENDDSQPSLLADLTPLLDVIFIVLVFLMLSANVAPLALPVDLPSMGAEQAEMLEDPQTLTVNLFRGQPAWGLDGQEFNSWAELSAAMLAERSDRPDVRVVVAGDRDVPMERLVQVLSFLQGQQWLAASILMENE